MWVIMNMIGTDWARHWISRLWWCFRGWCPSISMWRNMLNYTLIRDTMCCVFPSHRGKWFGRKTVHRCILFSLNLLFIVLFVVFIFQLHFSPFIFFAIFGHTLTRMYFYLYFVSHFISRIQLVAADVVKFLANNITSQPIVLHGFSVGGYLWGECMVHMSHDVDRYRHVLNQINCQIWDSLVELTELPVGVPKAVFAQNETLQRALSNYLM